MKGPLMRRRTLAAMAVTLLAAAACSPSQQQVEEAAQEVVATSFALTAIAQTAMAPTPAPLIITTTPQDTSTTPQVVTATPDPNVPTHVPAPTPAVETSGMSEEELAAAIDEAVAVALAESEQAAAVTTEATSDGTLSAEESVSVQVEAANAEEAIALAEALITAYYDVYGAYGAYAEEALALLTLMESDLDGIDEDLAYILTTMEQGQEAANALVAELAAAAQSAGLNAAEGQGQAQTLLEQLQAEREARLQEVLAAAPSQVPGTRREAIQSASSYVETVRGSLGDSVISQDELLAIAQAGANASAGLKAQGGSQLQGLADSINAMTAQLALGQLPQASANLGGLQAQIPSLPGG